MTVFDISQWPPEEKTKLFNWADGQDNFEWMYIHKDGTFAILNDEDVSYFLLSWAM